MFDNPFRTAALAAAARGWRVFPLAAGRKQPAIKQWEQLATCDRRLVTAWWTGEHAGANVGIACGRSALVVIDLDIAPPGHTDDGPADGMASLARAASLLGQPYPGDTFSVTTPSQGRHLYFTAPDGPMLRNSAGRIGRFVDTRAAGGYVVAAGSSTPPGRYRIVRDSPVAPLPQWLADALAPPARPVSVHAGQVGADRIGRYLAAAIRNETRAVATASPGTRHDTLLRSAVALGRLVAGGALDDDDTRNALLSAAAVHEPDGFTYNEAERVISDAFRFAARRPRHIHPV